MAEDQHVDKKQKTNPEYDWADSEEKNKERPSEGPKKLKVFNVISTSYGEWNPYEVGIKVRSYSTKEEAEKGMREWMIEKIVSELAETEEIPRSYEDSNNKKHINKIAVSMKEAIALSKSRGDWDDDIDDIVKKAIINSRATTEELFGKFFWTDDDCPESERMVIQESD